MPARPSRPVLATALALAVVAGPVATGLSASPAHASTPTAQQRQVTLNDLTRDALKRAGGIGSLAVADFAAVLADGSGALGQRPWESQVPLSVVDGADSRAFGQFSVVVDRALGTVGVATGGGTTGTSCAMAHVAADGTVSTWDAATVDGTCSGALAAAAPGSGKAGGGQKDRVAPAQPTGLTGEAGDGQVVLAWRASPEVDVVGYRVFQDGASVGGVTAPTSTITVVGLPNDVTRSFQVAAIDAAGNLSPLSAPLTLTPVDLTPPAVPDTLVAAAGDGVVSVSWRGVTATDLAGYHVYRGGALVATTTSTTAVLSGLTNFVTYELTVASFDLRGNVSAPSAPLSATPVDRTPPGVPTNIAAAPGDAQVVLAWDPVTDADLASYDVWVDGALMTSVHPGTTHVVRGLLNDTAYAFSISTTDVHGNRSARSADVTATPRDLTPPEPVTGLVATPGDGRLAVGWVASSSADVASYLVLLGGVVVAEVPAPATEVVLSGLVNQRAYAVSVAAVDRVGNVGAPSPVVLAAPRDDVAPDLVRDLVAVAGDQQASLSWTPSASADVARYAVLRDGVVVQELPATASSATVTGLVNYTTYTFVVVAVDAAGNRSTPSEPAVATPVDLTPAAVPSGLSGVPGDGSAALTWNAVDGADVAGYQVLQDGVVVQHVTAEDAGAPPTVVVAGLINGTSYVFAVASVDAHGNVSAPSPTVSVVPAATELEPVDLTDRTWGPVASAPVGRTDAAATRGGDGGIYHLGGSIRGVRTGSVDRYDPVSDTWSAVAPMLTPRAYHSAATDGQGRVYAIGGIDPAGNWLTSVERFDPATGVWTAVAPTKAAHIYSAAATDPQGRIYAVAGHDVSTVERFDPETGAWTTVAPVWRALQQHASVSDAQGRIYAIGGHWSGESERKAHVFRYDPSSNSWTRLDDLATARSEHSAATDAHGRIYAIGGYRSEPLASVERLDPATGQWTQVAGLREATTEHSSAVDSRGRIYVMGGWLGSRVERLG